MFGALCPVVIFLVHVGVSPVEDHQDYQEIWEVQRESETTFTQPEDQRGNQTVVCLQRNGMAIEKIFLRGVYSGKMRCNEHKF